MNNYWSILFPSKVTVGCGATSSENCTYFEVTGAIAGACRMNICKQNNICQVGITNFRLGCFILFSDEPKVKNFIWSTLILWGYSLGFQNGQKFENQCTFRGPPSDIFGAVHKLR